MDEEQAKALRKPFPPKAIGLKPQPFKKDSPKSKCEVCHGYHGQPATHLEYVGHAASTDRLLQVDPEWSWEPMAYDMNGLPLLDGSKNLWIKLTVCGVTRIGVGDGASIKECIGDAIRNSAMRFGVALDLWAKEDLGGVPSTTPSHVTEAPPAPPTRTMSRRRPPQTDDVAEPVPAGGSGAPPMPLLPAASSPSGPEPGMSGSGPEVVKGDHSTAQLAKIHILLGEQGMGERVAGLACLSDILDREVTSSKSLSKREAGKVIEALMRVETEPNTEPEPEFR